MRRRAAKGARAEPAPQMIDGACPRHILAEIDFPDARSQRSAKT
jgi:hypothetical protein